MANRFPLIVNSTANIIEELPVGDNLDLTNSDISNVANVNISGNLVVGGSVTFNGGFEFDNVSNLSITDRIVSVGGGNSGASLSSNDNKDRGLELHYYSGSEKTAFMGWDNSNGEFAFGSNVSLTDDIVTFNQYGNLRAGYIFANVVGSITGNLAAPGIDKSILFNDTGNANASASFTFDKSSNTVSIGNALSVSGNITYGNISGGNLVSANYVTGTLTTHAQPNITSVGTLTGLTVSGNIVPDANITYDIGNATHRFRDIYLSGSTIDLGGAVITTTNDSITFTNPQGGAFVVDTTKTLNMSNISNVQNGTSNVEIKDTDGNINFTVNGTPNVVVVTQTGMNVAGYVTASGNITGDYIVGNGSALSSITGGNVTGQVANALVASTVYTNAQPNITSVGTLTSLSVSGALTAGDTTIAGNLTVSGTTTTVNSTVTQIVDPIFELGGGANGAALSSNDSSDRGTLFHYYTTGAVDAFIGWDNSNAEFALGSNVTVSNNVVTFNTFGNLRAQTFIGSLSGGLLTNAQPNVTSVGTLSALTVAGNVDLGAVANVHISGGTANYVLATDGTGNLKWESPTAHISSLTSVVDTFTGDGSKTDFTLSTTPTNTNFTLVMVDGIIQPRSAFSLSGATLTLSSAPHSGYIVEVTTLGGSVTNGVNSGLTNSYTYTLSGTTTDGTETEVFVGNITNNRIAISNNTTATYDIQFVGRRTNGSGNAGFNVKGVISNDSGTASDVGTNNLTTIARSDNSYTVSARAGVSGNTLRVYVTGKTGHSMKWTAVVTTTEVSQ